MKMRELLGTAQVPGGDELRLYRRGDDFIIAIDPPSPPASSFPTAISR